MASREIKTTIRLLIKAGQAKPAPPVGPSLGQAGLNIMQFCKDFNAKTANFKPEVPIPVLITAYTDRSFDYSMKSPPTSYFLKKAAGLEKGVGKAGHEVAGTVSLKHIYEIAKVKQADDPRLSLESICKTIMAQCRSMGITVVAKPEEPS
ncbi:hypothetical protein BSKO_13681 [Bryopsis sp. KO-2023]|nr:hypothetical protein BSKO_13681 [Bryopsis sp. KO-2023]